MRKFARIHANDNPQAYMQKSKRVISFIIGSLLFADGLYFVLQLGSVENYRELIKLAHN